MPTLAYRPGKGNITTLFGGRATPTSPPHAGLDFGFGNGYEIYAAQTAPIIYAGPATGFGIHSDYGNILVQDLGGGWILIYAHIRNDGYVVWEGTPKAGTLIAWIGSTGKATGPHLHFEMRNNGVAVNPLPYLDNLKPAGLETTPILGRIGIPHMYLKRVPNGRIDVGTDNGWAPIRSGAHLTLITRVIDSFPRWDTFNDEESSVIDGYFEACKEKDIARTREIVAALAKITIDPAPMIAAVTQAVTIALEGVQSVVIDEAKIAAAVELALYDDFGALPTVEEIAEGLIAEIAS